MANSNNKQPSLGKITKSPSNILSVFTKTNKDKLELEEYDVYKEHIYIEFQGIDGLFIERHFFELWVRDNIVPDQMPDAESVDELDSQIETIIEGGMYSEYDIEEFAKDFLVYPLYKGPYSGQKWDTKKLIAMLRYIKTIWHDWAEKERLQVISMAIHGETDSADRLKPYQLYEQFNTLLHNDKAGSAIEIPFMNYSLTA